VTAPTTVVPVPVTEGLPATLELTLCKPAPAGTLLRLRANGIAMLMGIAIDEVVAMPDPGSPEAGVSLPPVHRFAWEEMQRNWMWHARTLSLAVVRTPIDLPQGARIEVRCGPTKKRATTADLTWTLYLGKVVSPETAEFTQVAHPLELSLVAGPVDHLEAALKADGRLFVEQFDAFGNPTRPEDGDELAVQLGEHRLRISPATRRAATAVNGLDPGRVQEMLQQSTSEGARPGPWLGVRGRVSDAVGRLATSNAWPQAIDGTPTYFGEFHWHTEFSGDGQRTLEAALTSARDELALDFAGPSDHLAPDGTYAHRLPIELVEICRRFDEPGRFCVIPGAELAARYGHVNLHTSDFDTFLDIVRRFPYELLPVWRSMGDDFPLEVLAALCPEGRGMIVPHHTNVDASLEAGVVHSDGRPIWCAMRWPVVTPLLHQGLRLVEMVQTMGAFETESTDPAWRVRWGGYGGSVQTALLRGHRVGFVGGSDNHAGWPTRDWGAGGTSGLTAIQAPDLDGETLFAALYQRRCYATSGVRIVADATLNGFPIGSELRLEAGSRRHFRLRIQGTAPLAAVQIVSMGAVVADLPVVQGAWDFDGSWIDDRPGRPLRDVYYYVRARQVDGHCVWLSPFWVDPPAPV